MLFPLGLMLSLIPLRCHSYFSAESKETDRNGALDILYPSLGWDDIEGVGMLGRRNTNS